VPEFDEREVIILGEEVCPAKKSERREARSSGNLRVAE
jgi:hypothetical protein